MFFIYRITDNLLAMARPSTEIIEKYNIIEQFQRYIFFFHISFDLKLCDCLLTDYISHETVTCLCVNLFIGLPTFCTDDIL